MLKLILCEMVLCCYHNSVWSGVFIIYLFVWRFQRDAKLHTIKYILYEHIQTRKTNNNHIHLFNFAIKRKESWFVLSAAAAMARKM